jgi:hypothetical protein
MQLQQSAAPAATWSGPLDADLCARAADYLMDRSERAGASLAIADAREIARTMRGAFFSDGDRFKFGTSNTLTDVALLLLHGEVSLQVRERERAPVALTYTAGEGEFLGLISMFSGASSPAIVRVNGDMVAGVLSKTDIAALAKSRPGAYGALMHLFTCDLAKTGADFLSRFSVMDRVTRGLQVELANAASVKDSGNEDERGHNFLETFELR